MPVSDRTSSWPCRTDLRAPFERHTACAECVRFTTSEDVFQEVNGIAEVDGSVTVGVEESLIGRTLLASVTREDVTFSGEKVEKRDDSVGDVDASVLIEVAGDLARNILAQVDDAVLCSRGAARRSRGGPVEDFVTVFVRANSLERGPGAV